MTRGKLAAAPLLALALLAPGCATTTYLTTEDRPNERVVQLRCCPLPRSYLGGLLSVLAVHPWFVSWEPGEGKWYAYEVVSGICVLPSSEPLEVPEKWGRFALCGQWGHVRRSERTDFDYGSGPMSIEHEWRGEEARAIARQLEAPWEYPDHDVYRAWPGPNSNTYAAWVLKSSGASADIHPRGVGKDYLGLFPFDTTSTGTGIQFDTPLVGVKVGLLDGVEVHLFCLTLLGVRLFPPALKTPLGLLGWDDSVVPPPSPRRVESEWQAKKVPDRDRPPAETTPASQPDSGTVTEAPMPPPERATSKR